MSSSRNKLAALTAAVAGFFALCSPVLEARDDDFAGAEPSQWERHHIREFGMSFDFPAHVFSPASAENVGDAVVFFTPDRRAKIGVFGLESSVKDTPRSLLKRTAKFEANRFTYVRTTPRFFAASGMRGDMIFYRRCNFSLPGDRRVGCLHVDYPRDEKRKWDDVVTRMSLSLRVAPRE